MRPADLAKLKITLREAIAASSPGARVALVGWSAAAIELAADPILSGGAAFLVGHFAPEAGGAVRPFPELVSARPNIVVIAEDEDKEELLDTVAGIVPPATKIIIGGFAHFRFRDEIFDKVQQNVLIPSFANGYPTCLVHIYQCLQNARRRELRGVVAEFGMFKGGTTMLISRFIEELGADWKVFGFDTFDGFPPKRSALDMYAHPNCIFLDVDLVRSVFAGRNVEIVKGDVVETVACLANVDLVLSFVDTDNFTSARAILSVIADRTQVGGAIIFDHWAGRDRHLYTVGEKMAARALAADPRYFNLHDTGVFLRQQ